MSAPPRLSPFAPMLTGLMKLRGVLGALVVDASIGIPVESSLAVGVDGDAVAALAASLLSHGDRATRAAGLGEGTYFQLQAEHGWLCVTGRGGLVLAVVAERRANTALLRISLLRACAALVP